MADQVTWETIAAQVAGEDVAPELRDAALDALPKMAAHLGGNWPPTALRSGHPLAQALFNRAPWTRQYLFEVADALETVSLLPRWTGLRSRLRQADQSVGALFELDLAARAMKEGLHVELEPATPGHRADLAISRSQEGAEALYVEAKHIQALPQAAYHAHALMVRVSPSSQFFSDLTGGGRFLRAPLSDELPILEERADAFWEERKRDHSHGELVIPGLLEMWAADRRDREAENYYVSRGYPPPGSFRGPPFDIDAFGRIYYAIRQKSEQLPSDAGGMIALEAPADLDLLEVTSEDVAHVVEKMLAPHPHVNAVALLMRRPSPETPSYERRHLGQGHYSIKAPRYLIYAEEVILVWNREREHRDADRIIERLFAVHTTD